MTLIASLKLTIWILRCYDYLNGSQVRAVMQETLRLYPAGPFLTRELAYDCEMSGYNIPAGVSSNHLCK
jgi:cytochrome P450